MKKALLAAMSVAAVGALTIVLVWYGVRTTSDTSLSATVERAPSPSAELAPFPVAEITPSRRPGLGFTALDRRRPLPELRFVDGEGRALALAEFRGRMILLNIWATWCAPCVREMPTLDRLQAELGGPDFEVVALSIDLGGLSAVKKFYRAHGIKALGIYADETGRARRDLGLVGIPTTLLVDRNGREIGRVSGPAEWDSPDAVDLIRGYLAEPVEANTRQEGPREGAAEPG